MRVDVAKVRVALAAVESVAALAFLAYVANERARQEGYANLIDAVRARFVGVVEPAATIDVDLPPLPAGTDVIAEATRITRDARGGV